MLQVGKIVFFAFLLIFASSQIAFAAQPPKDKDKTPPIISDLQVMSIASSSAVITWTTDELADSDIDYGIPPSFNKHGPRDNTLVYSHSIAIENLEPTTEYGFCALSKDEANNKSQACGVFTTTEPPPPPPPPPPPTPPAGGGGGGVRPTHVSISGLAYPGATVSFKLYSFFGLFGASTDTQTKAGEDGTFSLSLNRFPQGLYFFTLSATDTRGETSGLKRYQFDFSSSDAPLMKEKVIIPPTIILRRDKVTWGDDINVFGSTVPNSKVLVEVGGVSYEAQGDTAGQYEILINTARLSPGKVSVRARSVLSPGPERDYSSSKTVTLTYSSVPKADLNADGVVGIADFSRFLSNPVDMNADGKVNSTDISIFLRAFNNAR